MLLSFFLAEPLEFAGKLKKLSQRRGGAEFLSEIFAFFKKYYLLFKDFL
jgi:hypothetical protein